MPGATSISHQPKALRPQRPQTPQISSQISEPNTISTSKTHSSPAVAEALTTKPRKTLLPRKASTNVRLRRNHNNVATEPSPDPDNDTPLWRMLNVELILVIHLTASLITYMAVQDVLLDKACRVDLKFSEKICNALQSPEGSHSYTDENLKVQKLIGSINMWRTILENFLPIILVCQIGAWSDKYGRKKPMFAVMISFLIQFVVLLLAAQFKEQVGAWSTGLITSLIISLSGSSACFGMAIFSYVSDVTPADKLTARTSITGSSFFLGLTFGLVLGGQLARASFTHGQIFLIAMFLEAVGIVGLMVLVQERPRRDGDRDVSTMTMISDFCDLKHFRNAVFSSFERRPGNNRKKILLLLMCHSMILAPIYGESAVSYLHARRVFDWDAGSYSNFVTYKLVLGFIGNFVSMALFTEFMELSDPVLGIISCFSQMGSSLIFAFSTTVTLAYIAPIVSLFSGSIMAVPRSIVFKMIPNKDTGKVNSCMGSLESLTPLLVSPIYKYVYSSTLETFPGAFHLLSAGFMLPPIFVYIVFDFYAVTLLPIWLLIGIGCGFGIISPL